MDLCYVFASIKEWQVFEAVFNLVLFVIYVDWWPVIQYELEYVMTNNSIFKNMQSNNWQLFIENLCPLVAFHNAYLIKPVSDEEVDWSKDIEDW